MGGIANIATGNVDGAIAKVEQSLAKSIPLALSFLSRIFRVSGIGEKIKGIIQKVKAKIDTVVKKLMDKVAGLVAKMADGAKTGANAVVTSAKRLINGIFGKKSFVAGKENHSIWVKVNQNQPEIWIASTPREATAQINALETEAKTKNILPLVQSSLTVARAKVKQAQDNLKRKVAPGTNVDDTSMSRHATEAVNGVEFSIKDIFDQVEKHGAAATLKLNLNFANLKHEFWSANGRPDWSAATKRMLGTLPPDSDRRHVQAFDDIFKNGVAALNGKTYTEADIWLSGKGFKPSKLELPAIKNALRSYLSKEFNRIENLWVGENRENQQKGSEFGAAERELQGLRAGTPEYEAALARRSAAVVDPAKGTATGRKIGPTEQGWINQINTAVRSLGRYVRLHQSGSFKPNTKDYRDASDLRALTQANQRNLGDFSKVMHSSELSKIETALQNAATVSYKLNRILA